MRARIHWVTAALILGGGGLAAVLGTAGRTAAGPPAIHALTFANAHGTHRTFTTDPSGSIDFTNPFFQDLGTNGRTCFSCHRPAQGWTITPEEVQARFQATAGLDPLFRANDGSNCEGADLSTIDARRSAFTLLLDKGLIRVEVAVPADAEFEIVEVDDPYRCNAPLIEPSLYRRPLPTTNLAFLSAIMWDGRETISGHAITADLVTQASSATTGHAEGVSPSPAQLQQIVEFQMSLFTAQTQATHAGSLTAQGARAGPDHLSAQPFCIGINDPLNMLPAMPGACVGPVAPFNPVASTSFAAWARAGSPGRRAIARGEAIFNTRPFVIDNVKGLNGGPSDPVAGPIAAGTCTVCHDTPNVGNHSVAMALDIGLADASRRTADLPLYTLQHKSTGEQLQTTDPGRALVTGRWRDVGKFKGPILRGLAARPPYFHNGAAATLDEAVDFYEERFNLGLTAQEKADLVAFLRAL
jgi:cytochrome c peroxidase